MKTQHTKQYPAYVDRTGKTQVPFRALVRAEAQRNHEPVPVRPSYEEFKAAKVPQNHLQAWQVWEAEQEELRRQQEAEMLRTKFWDLGAAKNHKARLAEGHDATLAERRRIREAQESAMQRQQEREHRKQVGSFYISRAEMLGLPFGSIEEAFAIVHQAMHDEQAMEARMAEQFEVMRAQREEEAQEKATMYEVVRAVAPVLPEVPVGKFVAGTMPFIAAIAITMAEGAQSKEELAEFVRGLVNLPEKVKRQDERTVELVEAARRLRESEQYWEHDEVTVRPRGSRRGAGKATRLRARSVSSLRETLARLNVKPQPRFHEVKLISDIHAELQRRGEELEITSLINS